MSATVTYDPAEWLEKHWSPECIDCNWFEYHAEKVDAIVAKIAHNHLFHDRTNVEVDGVVVASVKHVTL